MIVIIIIWGFLFCGALFCFYMLFRNMTVFNERIRLIKVISALCNEDIEYGRKWQWRYDLLDYYNYDKMMWELCKFKWTMKDLVHAKLGEDK